MSAAMTSCTVCDRRVDQARVMALVLCVSCKRSFDRMNRIDSTHAGLIIWAARRARSFARRVGAKRRAS